MEQFENVIKIDPSRDEGQGYEKKFPIEKSDSEYYQSCEKYVIEEIREELGINNEKSKSKAAKKKSKKNDTRLLDTAVENF